MLIKRFSSTFAAIILGASFVIGINVASASSAAAVGSCNTEINNVLATARDSGHPIAAGSYATVRREAYALINATTGPAHTALVNAVNRMEAACG